MSQTIPKQVLELVDLFERNREAYRSPQYNETQLRHQFLDPFFKALGWDVNNEQGYAEAYKDVIHEDAIKVGEGTKAPDYCFRIGGARKFFLEAKRPAVDIKHDATPAFQLRRYAFTLKLPLNVLSDFEEFAVYDGRVKPDQRHNAAVARILYIPYTEYATRWDEIAGVFSRDAVLKGAFDKFAEANKAKRGTADVDEEFLKTIEGWRAELARNLALRNPKLSQRELNFAVQRIIDRIIFLRICEGRGIEDYGRLQALANGDRIYPRLAQQFEQADDRYNSGLFHFKAEKGRHEAPDELTLGLHLDDNLLRGILKSLYYPDCPYVFSELPADILGQVYEQFLGKIIRLTEGHRAVVEEKPEVKKAGGVYYTPTYIVEYIVQQTVGKLLEGKTPRQAAKLKILDPACGSGSFLLGAYECLLQWHLDYYMKNEPAKWAKGSRPELVQTSSGWKLTIAERKHILLNNIYGVDIDTQAVETTKLSLLLKVLEGETQQSLQPVLRMFQERALPDLGDNIKCGNSLIGPDFYQQQQLALLDEEERYRVNVFDWHKEFPEIFRRKISAGELREAAASPLDHTMPGVPLHGSYSYKKKKGEKAVPSPGPIEPEWEGGFDAVVGNPPYNLLQPQNVAKAELDYYHRKFKGAQYKVDIYHLFIEQSLRLVRNSGLISFITPAPFTTNNYTTQLRKLVLDNVRIRQLITVPDGVFAEASVDNAIFTFQKSANARMCEENEIDFVEAEAGKNQLVIKERLSVAQSVFQNTPGMIFRPPKFAGFAKLEAKFLERSKLLGDLARVNFGMQLRDRTKFPGDVVETDKPRSLKAGYKPCLTGRNVDRYVTQFANLYCLFDRVEQQGGCWDEEIPFDKNKVIVRQIGAKPFAAFDDTGLCCLNTVFMIKATVEGIDERFLLGVLNSKAIGFYWQNKFSDFKETFPKIKGTYLQQLPVPTADKARHDQMVNLVEQMLEVHQRLSTARTPPEKTSLGRQIAATDAQIDRLVYDLYGLTEEEIKIVEGAP